MNIRYQPRCGLCGVFLILCIWSSGATAQVQFPDGFIDELREFLALPNDANDYADMQRNLNWLVKAFTARGFTTQDLSTADYSLLFTERAAPDAEHTILFYLHYDGQPVDKAQWQQADPYQAVLKRQEDGGWNAINWPEKNFDPEDRIFARSASDDKGAIIMLLHAIDELVAKGESISHIKVILDGKEERSSPGLADIIAGDTALLSADYLIVIDGPQHESNLPSVYYGCRGLASASITTYGPIRPEHSGHFGNVAPNPAFALARLLTSMKDEHGRVLIDHFYDGVEITPSERALIDKLPDRRPALLERFQLARLDTVADSYNGALQFPSLNVRRLDAPMFAGVRTIVPDKAKAEIDIRLVPETPGQRQLDLLRDHLQALGYYVIDHEPTSAERMAHDKLVRLTGRPGIPAFQTPPDAPIANYVRTAIVDSLGIQPVEIPLMGGTVPITPFIKILDIPALVVPLANSDNNQHSPNENLRLGNAAEGIKVLQALMRARD